MCHDRVAQQHAAPTPPYRYASRGGTGRWCPTGTHAGRTRPQLDLGDPAAQDQLRRLADEHQPASTRRTARPRGIPPSRMASVRGFFDSRPSTTDSTRTLIVITPGCRLVACVRSSHTRRARPPPRGHQRPHWLTRRRADRRNSAIGTTTRTRRSARSRGSPGQTGVGPGLPIRPDRRLGQGPLLGRDAKGFSSDKDFSSNRDAMLLIVWMPPRMGAVARTYRSPARGRGGPARSNRARHRPRWPRRRPATGQRDGHGRGSKRPKTPASARPECCSKARAGLTSGALRPALCNRSIRPGRRPDARRPGTLTRHKRATAQHGLRRRRSAAA